MVQWVNIQKDLLGEQGLELVRSGCQMEGAAAMAQTRLHDVFELVFREELNMSALTRVSSCGWRPQTAPVSRVETHIPQP